APVGEADEDSALAAVERVDVVRARPGDDLGQLAGASAATGRWRRAGRNRAVGIGCTGAAREVGDGGGVGSPTRSGTTEGDQKREGQGAACPAAHGASGLRLDGLSSLRHHAPGRRLTGALPRRDPNRSVVYALGRLTASPCTVVFGPFWPASSAVALAATRPSRAMIP